MQYQPYDLTFGHEAPTIHDTWLRLANCNDNYSQSNCAWMNEQHECIFAANRHASKYIKCSEGKLVSHAGGKALEIPIGNCVLLKDHPEGQNKIQDNYKSEQLIMDSKHQDPNVHSIKPLDGNGPMHTMNWQQLYILQKSQGDTYPACQAPDTNLSQYCTKKIQPNKTPKQVINMEPGPRSG